MTRITDSIEFDNIGGVRTSIVAELITFAIIYIWGRTTSTIKIEMEDFIIFGGGRSQEGEIIYNIIR